MAYFSWGCQPVLEHAWNNMRDLPQGGCLPGAASGDLPQGACLKESPPVAHASLLPPATTVTALDENSRS